MRVEDDAAIGGIAPRWGTPGVLSDPCPTRRARPSTAASSRGRLSRLQAAGNVMTGASRCWSRTGASSTRATRSAASQFGPDGALYATAGDGASFNFADWGQDGSPLNPCGDPPGGVGAALTPPTAEGGRCAARTCARPATRPPSTGRSSASTRRRAGAAGQPARVRARTRTRAGSSRTDFRNPFRITFRPGTNEVWVGDVGWNTWEEINRVIGSRPAAVENFGWPCYEGDGRQSGYDARQPEHLREPVRRRPGAVTAPYFT